MSIYHRTNCRWQHYFDDTSLLRQVVGHRLDGALRAARAAGDGRAPGRVRRLLRPHGRARRPLRPAAAHRDVMDAVAFGTKARADKLTAHVRAMHRTRLRRAARGRRAVPGRHALPRRRSRAAAVDPRRAGRVGDARLPASTSARCRATSWTRCGATTASSAAASACASATCRATSTPSRPTWRDMYASGDLYVTPAARELAIDIVLHPPVPLRRQAAGRAGEPDHGRAGCPRDIRRQYGFRWDPLRAVALRGGAEYVKRLRAARRRSTASGRAGCDQPWSRGTLSRTNWSP